MPYELQTDKIIAGSLNLLSPGDMGGDSDALALHNWRIDQAGQLRTRLGTSAPIQEFDGAAFCHTIGRVERATPARYYGVDATLYRDDGTLTSLSSGFDGQPLGIISFQNRAWVMNRGLQKKDDGTNPYNWTPTAPAAAPTAAYAGSGGALNGIYNYYVTGVTDAGEETNPSPALTTGSLVNDVVTITQPTFTDAQITKWNVYRQGGSFPTQKYLMNTTPIALATTTLVDNGNSPYSDDDLANFGKILEVNHDPAPAARFVVGPFLGKLLAFGTAANPNRMFWTEADQPAFFPGSGDIDGNWADVGEQGEEFVGAAVFPQVVLIIKEKSLWRLLGDPSDPGSQIERLNVELGGIGLKSWVVAGSQVYIQGKEGIYRISVSSTDCVSQALVPIFKGDAIDGFGAIPGSLNTNVFYRKRSAMAYINGRLYFSFATGNNTLPDTTLVYNEATSQWASDNRGFTALYYEGQTGQFLSALVVDGVPKIAAIEDGVNDNGAMIQPTFQTRFRTQGQPTEQKHYSNLQIEHRLNGGILNVYAIFDQKGSTQTLLGTITSNTDKTWSTLPIPDFDDGNEPRSIAIRIETHTGASDIMEVFTINLRYYVVPSGGVVFDSGNIKLTDGQVCLINNLEMDLENLGAGTISYEWFSDLPGNQIASVGVKNIAGVVGVGTFTVAAPVEYARWARLIIRVSSGLCRVYGARVRIRPIGEHLDGVSFDTGPFRIDTGQPCFVNAIELDLENIGGGEVTWQWYSDLPGNALQARGGFTALTSGTGGGTFRAELPVREAAWARLVVRTSTGFVRVYGARVQVRPIGLYMSGAGDDYVSAELAAGSPRLKLISGVRVAAQADGEIPFTLSTDVPPPQAGTALSVAATEAIPATTERQWFSATFPSNTRARLLRVKLQSSAVARIFAVLLRVKALGESPSSWEWYEVPIPQTTDVWATKEIPVTSTPDVWQWREIPIP